MRGARSAGDGLNRVVKVAPGTAAEVAAIALLGAVVGRFLNVLIDRVPRGESLLSLRWRRCGGLSARYPLVELLAAAAFGAVATVRGVRVELVALLPFVALLVAVACIDLEHRIIPNRLLAPAAFFAVAANVVVRPSEVPELALAGAIAFLLLLLPALAHPAGMGMGDVKLGGVMGLYLGVAVAPAMLVAFIAGSLIGAVKVAREGRAARKSAIPFAPFMALGGLLGMLAGPALVHAYQQHFLA